MPDAEASPLRASGHGRSQRKCACGGVADASGECEECRNKRRLGLQTKLKVNEPGDIYEQEADRVADQVVAMSARDTLSSATPHIHLFSASLQWKMDAAPASVDRAHAGPGIPLEPALRRDMEQCFGYGFAKVRIHSGVAAEQSAREVNASAYTVGPKVVFRQWTIRPLKRSGTSTDRP